MSRGISCEPGAPATTMIFGTPVDITLSELALETFFPADDLTAERMRKLAASLK
jgi:hypothetical protein